MNAIVQFQPKPMLLDSMADKYGLRPQEFADTVRKTCGLATATAEEFAAFIMVAKEYDLNPMLREIYAFPKKGGGIVPIVSIDGWVNLVNSHPACDGFEFDIEHAEDKALVSITCRMYRKDRNRPVVVTEYYDECKRDTEPWKMKHRMLRHKAMIQAARYAFGFSGIYDEDEGAKIAEMRDVTPAAPPLPPSPPAPPSPPPAVTEAEVEEAEPFDASQYFHDLEDALACAMDEATVEEVWTSFDVGATFEGDDLNFQIAGKIKGARLKQLGIETPVNILAGG